MRINISVELRRPSRRSVALIVGAMLLLTPAAVLASHYFPDVPADHPFHDQISAIAKAGITAGFGDGTYRPGDPVTRQSMAAFMERGFGRVGLVIDTPPMTPSLSIDGRNGYESAAVSVRQLTITVPGARSAFDPTQSVHLIGRVAINASMSGYCPCQVTAWIRDMVTEVASPAQFEMLSSPTGDIGIYTVDVEALFAAPPGARTYQLEARIMQSQRSLDVTTFDLHSSSSLSAATFPFEAQRAAE